MDDNEALGHFVLTGSEDAFGQLFQRYTDLVYSAALRQVRDPALAEDVTQAVFIILAKKARSLRRRGVLGPWLLKTTHYVARDTLKAEFRRRRRERKVAEMRPESQNTNRDWDQIAGVLDECMTKLSHRDRQALVLRFFEEASHRDLATALGTSEDGARQSLSRALKRLHGLLGKRGVVTGEMALGSALLAYAVQPANASAVAATHAVLAGTTSGCAKVLAAGMLKKYLAVKALAIAAACVAATAAVATTAVVIREAHHAPRAPAVVGAAAATQPRGAALHTTVPVKTMPPLCEAARRFNLPWVEQLLAEGALVNERCRTGNDQTPLLYVAGSAERPVESGVPVARALIAAGADLNARNNYGYTALHLAVVHRNTTLVEFLLDKGADASVPDFRGRTPLARAQGDGNAAMVAILMKHKVASEQRTSATAPGHP